MRLRLALLFSVLFVPAAPALPDEPEDRFEWHAQSTYIRQFKGAMRSPYEDANSLRGAREASDTLTGTLFLALHPVNGTEIYFNPEWVRGTPFSGLHGTGGFTNGEIQRGGGASIRGYRARLFVRQTWNLGGEWEDQASEQNQVRTRYASERLVLTAGNLSVLDVFDAVDYSRDPRTQFLNWSSLTYGAFDYPADARGYTWGAALEYITPGWQGRAGRFLVPKESNGLRLNHKFTQYYGDAAEVEVPYRLFGRPAVARALVFRNRVYEGSFRDALDRAAATGAPPDLTTVHRIRTKIGAGAGTQVEVTPSVGAYVRLGWNDGRTQAYQFTEIDRSLATGVLLKGGDWGRPGDTVGAAAYVNGLSRAHRRYLSAGGQTFFLGDGRLAYGSERTMEAFYSAAVAKRVWLTFNVQRMENPGYNRDRGPANFLGFRLHTEI